MCTVSTPCLHSAAIRVMEILQSEGVRIEYHDPYVPRIRLAKDLFAAAGDAVTLESIPLTPERLAAADCVAILVAHSNVDYAEVVRSAKLVFDAVNATRGKDGRGVVERL